MASFKLQLGCGAVFVPAACPKREWDDLAVEARQLCPSAPLRLDLNSPGNSDECTVHCVFEALLAEFLMNPDEIDQHTNEEFIHWTGLLSRATHGAL